MVDHKFLNTLYVCVSLGNVEYLFSKYSDGRKKNNTVTNHLITCFEERDVYKVWKFYEHMCTEKKKFTNLNKSCQCDDGKLKCLPRGI